jgi:hypothetical protein
MRAAAEFFYSACTTELQIQESSGGSGGRNSLAFSRLCRRIADDLLHHFADSRYFAKLCKEIKPQSQQQEPQPYAASVAASLTSTVPALKLLDLRFVLMEDLGFLERVYRQLYMQLSETAEDILIDCDDGSCFETVELTQQALLSDDDEFGLKLNLTGPTPTDGGEALQTGQQAEAEAYRVRRDNSLAFPLIVEDVRKGSDAYKASLRRGMVLVASRKDLPSMSGEQRFLQLELIQPLTSLILAVGDLCEELNAVRLLADSMGDEASTVAAYRQLCDYDPTLAYDLVSSAPSWKMGLSQRIADLDTSTLVRRQLSSSSRTHRGYLHAEDRKFEVRWWNNARGAADQVPLLGSQFLTIVNNTDDSTLAWQESLDWQISKSGWWQRPPTAVDGGGGLVTWAATAENLYSDTKGAVVFSGRSSKSGEDFAIGLGWSTPSLGFAPFKRKKLLRQGFGPVGCYPRKPVVLMEHPRNLRRPEQLEAHFERAVGSRQCRAQCHLVGLAVRCEILTKVNRVALVEQLEHLSLRDVCALGVEHGVWSSAAEAEAAAEAAATKQDLMQEIVTKLCGDGTAGGCSGAGSMFTKREKAVTDKDIHQCVFVVSEMTESERRFATHLDELVARMNKHSSLVAETRRHFGKEYANCFVGSELVDWLVAAVQQSGSELLQPSDGGGGGGGDGEAPLLSKLVPAEASSQPMGCEQRSELLERLLRAVQTNAATPTATRDGSGTDAAAAADGSGSAAVAQLRRGIVFVCQEMIDLGWVRHVVDEHDFKDEGLFYRATYIPRDRAARQRVRKGYMEKEPGQGIIKAFEKRWFELEQGTGKLYYYKGEFGKKAGTIPPEGFPYGILDVKASAGSKEIRVECGEGMRESMASDAMLMDSASFSGGSQGRTYVLRASSAADAQEWADAILAERNAAAGRMTVVAAPAPGGWDSTGAATAASSTSQPQPQSPEPEPELLQPSSASTSSAAATAVATAGGSSSSSSISTLAKEDSATTSSEEVRLVPLADPAASAAAAVAEEAEPPIERTRSKRAHPVGGGGGGGCAACCGGRPS